VSSKPRSPADQREFARITSFVLMGAFVLLIGLAVAFHFSGAGRVLVAGVVVLVVVLFALVMLWPVHPRELTEVQDRTQSGSWPALLSAGDIPSVLVTHPTINHTVKLPGRAALTEHGVVWTPSRRTVSAFQVGPQHWPGSWSIRARRLRGLGGQAQLDLTSPDGTDTTTLWIWKSKSLKIG
jgi:hypothetical protein